MKYACNKCDHQATTKGALKSHLKSIHEGVKYNCKECNHEFSQKGTLRSHMKKVHSF